MALDKVGIPIPISPSPFPSPGSPPGPGRPTRGGPRTRAAHASPGDVVYMDEDMYGNAVPAKSEYGHSSAAGQQRNRDGDGYGQPHLSPPHAQRYDGRYRQQQQQQQQQRRGPRHPGHGQRAPPPQRRHHPHQSPVSGYDERGTGYGSRPSPAQGTPHLQRHGTDPSMQQSYYTEYGDGDGTYYGDGAYEEAYVEAAASPQSYADAMSMLKQIASDLGQENGDQYYDDPNDEWILSSEQTTQGNPANDQYSYQTHQSYQ